jgi:hypothetical protein
MEGTMKSSKIHQKTKCTLVHPESGQKVLADILSKDDIRMTVRPQGTKIEIFMVRADKTIPYRGSYNGQYFTAHID